MAQLNNYIENNYSKIIGWGTGGYYKKFVGKLSSSISYLIDSDPTKQGLSIGGKKVCSPNTLKNEDKNAVLIVVYSISFEEIYQTIHDKLGDFDIISGSDLLRLENIFSNVHDNLEDTDFNSNKTIISISRNNFLHFTGGTSKFITEQMEYFSGNNYNHIHLTWNRINVKKFRGIYIQVVKNGVELGMYKLNELLDKLQKVKCIVVHNLIGMELDIFTSIKKKLRNPPVFYYLHDFSCVCRNIKLMYNDNYFCESYRNNWNMCLSCKYKTGRNKNYSFHSELFRDNNMYLIAPSNNTKQIITSAFNFDDDKISIIPHQKYNFIEKNRNVKNKKLRIAYVGSKHKHKGWGTFKEICKAFNNSYDFYCLGNSDEIIEGVKYVEVSYLENGELAMTKKLKEFNIDIALLWSECPETYSYTYYESSAAGCLILTNTKSGNIHDQVMINNNGISLERKQDLYNLLTNKDELLYWVKQSNKSIETLKSNVSGFADYMLRVIDYN
ncbi:hypothetical protein [Gracilibacillus lacisalsi]|uniref:hypothetical protein n=1 Tax=Gracilibacillus lacisalsi TaxID=393087 RepID=UPI00035DD987|nr:hypothetical protein [Gracilibacillus lacisalsi]